MWLENYLEHLVKSLQKQHVLLLKTKKRKTIFPWPWPKCFFFCLNLKAAQAQLCALYTCHPPPPPSSNSAAMNKLWGNFLPSSLLSDFVGWHSHSHSHSKAAAQEDLMVSCTMVPWPATIMTEIVQMETSLSSVAKETGPLYIRLWNWSVTAPFQFQLKVGESGWLG